MGAMVISLIKKDHELGTAGQCSSDLKYCISCKDTVFSSTGGFIDNAPWQPGQVGIKVVEDLDTVGHYIHAL